MTENFDWKTYLDNYQDLTNARINTKEDALFNWKLYGKHENRIDVSLTDENNIYIKFTNFIINKIPFIYAKFGDGEYICMNKYKDLLLNYNCNCDNDSYTINLIIFHHII